ncbi:MAG: HEPN domain-containing protein [Lachnospiraceae bacterium]|nr:HEPN domain-containing protein [Lachnospiraceae bacterium]
MSQYRLNNAKERLESSKILLDNNQYLDSKGRSYYAMFSAVRALLATEEIDFSKHSAVIAHFQKDYIKTGKLQKENDSVLSEI